MFRHLWQSTEYWRVLWNAMSIRYGNIIRTQAEIEINKKPPQNRMPINIFANFRNMANNSPPKKLLSQTTGIFKKKRCYVFSHTRQST